MIVSSTATIPTSPPEQPLLFNRETSWLDFNKRVLELAQDIQIPLLERVRFAAIFASNLDEFFMKRVGALHRQRASNFQELTYDGLTTEQQLTLIHKHVRPLVDAHIDTWLNDLQPALEREGVVIRAYDQLDGSERATVDDVFLRQVYPLLTPLAVDPGHPFPFISNLSKSIAVWLEHPGQPEPAFVRIKVPENISRWVQLPGTRYQFVPVEQVIQGNLSHLFPGSKVLETHLFRATRNADIETDEEDADDLLELIQQELRRRRMAQVVRLELPVAMGQSMREFIIQGLEVNAEDVYNLRGPVDMDDLVQLANLDMPHLRYKPWSPLIPPRLRDEDMDMFSVIRAGDLIVHHPYEDFNATVTRFIDSAVEDPKVLAIKMTLYRTSTDSPFVAALIRAAETGKQVACLVELKARFDEERNVALAKKMEKAGVHVVYGLVGLKTHTKIAMVVRDDPDGLRTYAHIGTGNYNSKTAALYTDVGLFTCNPLITSDVIDLFHYLTGRSTKRDYRKLLVAPVNMRDRFHHKIRREIDNARAGLPARIIAKMNALQDPRTIKTLYEASQAGVKIELIVRGFCCLRPGVPGLSENIRVISVLGRFLEHSRIFYFHNNGSAEYYIGSADWMNRNLDFRVEAIAPVEDPAGQATLQSILNIMLADTSDAWELHPDGTWTRIQSTSGKPGIATQVALMDQHRKTLRKSKRARG
jgi:polyphosphate kinase